MKAFRMLGAAALAALLPSSLRNADAAAADYQFQILEPNPRQGDAVVAVRLIDKRTGHPVPDAIVFAMRMDMEPDGMEAMTAQVQALPAEEPGVYRFRTTLAMEGGWRFSIAAKVQGEPETVQAKLILRVSP